MNRLVNRVTKVRDAIHSPKSVVALLVAITVLLSAASNIPAALTVTPDSRPSTFPDAVAPHTAFPTISSTMSLTDNLALYPPSPNPRFQPRIVPIANNSAHYRNSDDNLTPRPREKKITFRRYLDCLAQRLNVDRHRREELPFTNLTATIPYLLVIATVELRDVKALMCNIDVPVRRLMYVQNGPVGSVTRFFDDVQRAFSFTSRLKIVRYENNIGFAGAVNTGMRDAMQYSFDEVPFFHLSNNDVRFTPGLFSDVLPQFYEVTQKDKAVMEKLAAEVATEPNEFSPPTRRHRVLRTFSENGTTVVTSRLLPDRIRYSSNQKTAFKGHKGILFYDRSDTTATLSLSRLMMETVGFYDENFYPAYFEDVDIRWRYQGLGFDEYRPKGYGGSVTHFTNVVQKTGAVMYGKVSDTDVYAQHLLGLIRRMFPYSYASSKWGTADQFGAPYLRCKNPFCNQRMKDAGVAIDSFVIDERRRSAISADGFGVANFDERLVDHLR